MSALAPEGPSPAPERLAILLPITSAAACGDSGEGRDAAAERILGALAALNASLGAPSGHPESEFSVVAVLGVDADDGALLSRRAELERALPAAARTSLVVFDPRRQPRGALNAMHARLAETAVTCCGASLAVLLGDDTAVEPRGWPSLVAAAFGDPALMVMVATLVDAADPGFPSFPVLRVARHLATFGGRLLPDAFDGLNQGGDPFLAELYRRAGAQRDLRGVSVSNAVGGPLRAENASSYAPPRYVRAAPSPAAMHAALEAWAPAARAAAGRSVRTVNVLVPSHRAAPDALRAILESDDGPAGGDGARAYDVRFVVVVDDPACPAAARRWLADQQRSRLGRLRVRFHDRNLGASAARNTALDEATAEYVVFIDDDAAPLPGALAAYSAAMAAHPAAAGFAGPTFLPHGPRLLPCAVHLSDVSFFWGARRPSRAAAAAVFVLSHSRQRPPPPPPPNDR